MSTHEHRFRHDPPIAVEKAHVKPASEPENSAHIGTDTGRSEAVRAWAALGVIALGLFLAVASTTMVGLAASRIGADLHASADELEWIVDAYVLVYSSLLVAGGVLGDHRGRKGVFLIGVLLFGLGSIVAGAAPTIGILIAGRALQGLGPALLVPGSLTIIRALFPSERQRAIAIGLWSTASGVALALGPILGGVLIDVGSWRWVFLFNAPLAAIVAVLAARLVPQLPRNAGPARFDWAGAILTITTITLLAYGTIVGPARGWLSTVVVSTLTGGAATFAALVAWEARVEHPHIQVRLFVRPAFAVANLSALVVFFAFVGGIVYFSAYFQQVRHMTAIDTGLAISAIGVAFAIAASQSGRLVVRIGPAVPMLVGLTTAGVAMLGLLRLQIDTPISALWWNSAVLGAGIGLSLTPMTAVAMSAVDDRQAGMVSAVHNALRQVGQLFGVAVLGALVYTGLPAGVSAGTPSDRRAADLMVTGLHHAIWLSGLALLACAATGAVVLGSARRT